MQKLDIIPVCNEKRNFLSLPASLFLFLSLFLPLYSYIGDMRIHKQYVRENNENISYSPK